MYWYAIIFINLEGRQHLTLFYKLEAWIQESYKTWVWFKESNSQAGYHQTLELNSAKLDGFNLPFYINGSPAKEVSASLRKTCKWKRKEFLIVSLVDLHLHLLGRKKQKGMWYCPPQKEPHSLEIQINWQRNSQTLLV